jgi:hypothetical protein
VSEITDEYMQMGLHRILEIALEEGPIYDDSLTNIEPIGHRKQDLRLAKDILETLGKHKEKAMWTDRNLVTNTEPIVFRWDTGDISEDEDFLQ